MGTEQLRGRPLTSMSSALWRQLRQIAIGIVVLGVLLGAFGLFVRWGVLQILKLEGETARVVFAGILALLTAFVVKSLEHYFVASLEKKTKLAERRREVYEEFIKFWFETMWSSREVGAKRNEEAATRELVRKLEQMTPRLMVWASDIVIRQFSRWRVVFGSGDPKLMMDGLYRLICEVRKEVGHGASTLAHRELLGVFLNDADKYFP